MDSKRFLDEISGKSINFLIGAGASAGAVPTLSLQSINSSFENILASDEYNEKQKNILYYIWFNLWIRKTKIDIEKSNGDELTKINETLKNYNNFLGNLVRTVNNEGFDKHKRINIFTTNYDTFFELAFDKYCENHRLVYFNDGSRGFMKKYVSTEDFYLCISHTGVSDNFQRSLPIVNLIKLHGSVTWAKERNKIKVCQENEVFNELVKKSDEINNKIINDNDTEFSELKEKINIANIENYLKDKNFEIKDLEHLISKLNEKYESDFQKFIDIYNKLPIVNPTKRKFNETVFEQHYYQMLRLLSFELEKDNSVLIVFGFSFADEHILEIVRRSMVNPKLKIYVIAYSETSQKEIKKRLGNETRIEYLPDFNNDTPAGGTIAGNFEYLNSLFG